MDVEEFRVRSRMSGISLDGPQMNFEISFTGCCTAKEYTELVDELYRRLFKGARKHER